MAKDKSRDPEQQQNISEVLEMLRQSYVEDDKETEKDDTADFESKSGDMSDDDLQQMLRKQFIIGEPEANEKTEESYDIDEEFLEEASKMTLEPEAELEEVAEAEEEIEELVDDELPWDEEPEEVEETEETEEIEETEDLEEYEELDEDDDDKPLTAEELALIQAFAELDDEDEDDGGFVLSDGEVEEEIEELEDDELPWDEDPEETEQPEEAEEVEQTDELDEDMIPVHVKDEEFRFMEMPIPEREVEKEQIHTFDVEEESEDYDDDLTFDQLAESDGEEDGIELMDIPLDEDDDLTFDQLEATDEADDDILYTPIELEEAPIEELETALEQEAVEVIEEINETEEIEAIEEIDELVDDVDDIIDDVEDIIEEIEEENSAEIIEDGDVADKSEETLEEITLVEPSAESQEEEKPAVSSADLSILLQFGCDDEILEIATDEDIEKLAISDSIESIDEEKIVNSEYGAFDVDDDDLTLDTHASPQDIHQTLEEKVVAIYDAYPKKRGAAFLRLLATGFMTVLLFLYEALPLVGVQLPGIMDRKEYFLAYVLIGLQLLLLAILPSIKQIWGGIKRMFSRSADDYSMLAILLIVTVVYDAFVMSVKIGNPQVFHFMVAMCAACIVGAECMRLTQEMNNFKYFFEDIIEKSVNDDAPDCDPATDARFTLKRSAGKGSTADKMYGGGLDPTKNVYVPINVSSAAGYFSAYEEKSRKSRAPMVLMLPAMVLSLLIGIIAIIVNGGEDVYIGIGTMLISLMLILPIGVVVTSWLPFEVFNSGCQKQGFSFVNEHAAEQYASCNVFVFKDMHVFEKCAPRSVNLATYDATSKEVLIGCLGSLYSEIGGPLANVFSLGNTNENAFGDCRLRRVAKSGVEAVVGANYSVLLGNEQFMARYGISFPGITFKHKGDEIYSLCLSINGRATARIIVKYTVNEMFEMFAKRLEEDGIYCAIETFDPMISSRLLTKLRGSNKSPLSVVHLGIDDYEATSRQEARPLGEEGAKLGLMAKRSRLNLAVATTSAKKMKEMRKKVNIFSFFAALLGTGLSFLFTMLGWMESVNEFVVLTYWFLLAAAFVAIVLTGLPQKDRFSLEVFKQEESIENMADSILDQ